ncbi:MAG: radical SAM/SPASM domain-containing protein [Chthoniobacterales bacterium]
MDEHLIFCSDLARRDPADGRITRVEGWCIATTPIGALYLYNVDIQYEQLPLGFPRPDVRAAYPLYPGAEDSGFRLTIATQILFGGEATLFVRVGAGIHRVSVNFDTREVQKIALNDTTAVEEDHEVFGALEEPAEFENRFLRSLGKQRALTLRLDIINKCNLRCVMCHFSDDAIFKRPTTQLTTDEFKRLFDGIGPSVREVMLSCGDEPLVSKHLPGILEYLAREHPEVAIEFCTNAMLLRAPIRRCILETGVARLLFSIDAVSKPLLESIRVGCSYEQVVGNIMALRDLRRSCGAQRPTFVFNFVMMNRNIHEAPAFVRMAQALGAESIDFRHLVPIKKYFSPDDLLADQPARYNFYRARILAEANRLGVGIFLPPAFAGAGSWTPPLEEPEVDWTDFNHVQPQPSGEALPALTKYSNDRSRIWEGSVAEEFSTTFCNRPFSEITLRDQNEVLPCPFHEKPLGFLSEGKTLAEIFHGEAFQRLRRNMFRPEGDPACANCPIKSHHLPISAS